MPHEGQDHMLFCDAVQGLLRGDFSRLEPLFKGLRPLKGANVASSSGTRKGILTKSRARSRQRSLALAFLAEPASPTFC
jgi:hypothetical protein